MRLLIKGARIIDPNSPYHNKVHDVFIRNGKIHAIGRNLNVKHDKVVSRKNLHVSTGWVDIGTQVGEPGFEQREDLQTVSAAATAGGFTTLACFPNTSPALHSKSEIEYILNSARTLPVDIHPIGAVSRDCQGEDIAEMHEMAAAGAVGFSDGRHTIQHTGLMLRALQYVKTFDGLVINRPLDRHLSAFGQIHESKVSAMLGMRGIPAVAERVMLERDLRLLEYTESRLLAFGVSTADSIRILKSARKSDLRLDASVAAAHLYFTDEDLQSFDANLKVIPPLRSASDKKALIKAVRRGSIRCICSNHEPREEEYKKREFANAQFGSSGLQTAFPLAWTALSDKVPIEDVISCFTRGPREILGLATPVIDKDQPADITVFDPDAEWTVTRELLRSKSKNEAALGKTLKGNVIGIVKNDHTVIH